MKKSILTVIAALAIGVFTNNAFAQTTNPPAAPAPAAAAPAATADVLATLTSTDNAANYETMAVVLRAANLGATLKGAGPYTIFAPNNDAFGSLTPAQLDALFADPAKLATVLRGHIVAGLNDKKAILAAIRATGTMALKTIDGATLTLSVNAAKNLVITDAQGNSAKVIKFDMVGTNGVAIGLDAVLYK
jgi:uncharacterized surface protein with fasciclin (FAS1) repeats